jgi:hypothetical protein
MARVGDHLIDETDAAAAKVRQCGANQEFIVESSRRHVPHVQFDDRQAISVAL